MTTATVFIMYRLGNGFSLPLMTICPSKLQPSQLKGHEAVSDLNDVDERVELVVGQYEEIS
jgi:hypothetical protein